MIPTDPLFALIIFLACLVSGSVSFVIGAAMSRAQWKKERRRIWDDADRLFQARSILDLRDNTPR